MITLFIIFIYRGKMIVMKKLLLLVGLVVFLTPMVVNANSLEEELAHYDRKFCQGTKLVEKKIAILHPDGYFICATQKEIDNIKNQNNTTSLDLNKLIDDINQNINKETNFVSANNTVLLNSQCIMDVKSSFYVFCFCENIDGQVYNVTSKTKQNYCKNGKEITYGKYMELDGYLPYGLYEPFDESKIKKLEEKKWQRSSLTRRTVSNERATLNQNNRRQFCFDHVGNRIRCGVTLEKKQGVCFDHVGNRISCGVLLPKKESEFNELAVSLGCGSKNKDVIDCVRRYLPSISGTGQMTLEQIEEIKNDKELMGEIVFAIEEINRQKSQSRNMPTEEEKKLALAQANATPNPTWMYTPGGIGYWNYGNGFGWAPPNPKRDKIIRGLSISWKAKQRLMTGSKGMTIFFAPR